MAYKIARATDDTGNLPYWIGVNDKQTEGSFVYESNGSPISFRPKFRSGYGSAGTSSNCILYATPSSWHESDNVYWLDMSCTGSAYSICENST
jgi:hypothetical protein